VVLKEGRVSMQPQPAKPTLQGLHMWAGQGCSATQNHRLAAGGLTQHPKQHYSYGAQCCKQKCPYTHLVILRQPEWQLCKNSALY